MESPAPELLLCALRELAVPVALTDAQGSIVWTNAEFERWSVELSGTGLPADLPGLFTGQADAVRSLLRDAASGGSSRRAELVCERPGHLEISATPLPDADGQIRCLVCVLTPQSPPAEASLRNIAAAWEASEQRYRELFENSPIGIYRTAPDGRILLVNPALVKLLGYPSEAALKARNLEAEGFEPGYDRSEFRQILEEHGEIRGREEKWRRTDGTYVVIRESCKAVRGRDGRIVFYEGVVEDITDRAHAQEEKSRLEEQLRQAQKLESIGRLAGGIAHDFNNLLTVINGFGDLLLRTLGLDDPLRAHVQQIRRAGERAATLTQQLLAYGRKQMIQPKPLNLNSIVTVMQGMLERLLGEDIELSIALNPLLESALVDPDQIQQVLMNLVVNARDAMPLGGCLSIETSGVRLQEDLPTGYGEIAPPGAYVLLTVRDTGVGMDAETKARIFDPFFTTKEPGKGTGLGLSMVYGIVRQSCGWVLVDSSPGQGTAFRLYFPAVSDPAAPENEPETLAPPEAGTETILVVEDQAEVRLLTCTVLRAQGYRTIEAANGTEAIRQFEQNRGRVHLLLTDIVLPGMSGKELAEYLLRRDMSLKVLYVSGYSEELIGDRGILETTIDYLPKPYTPNALARRVRQILEMPERSPKLLS